VRLRLWSLLWFLGAVALPVAAWHGVAAKLAARFRLELGYLVSAWGGFALIALGLLCFIPVLISVGRSPESRLYPRNRAALIGWGTSFYLLGTGLMVQVAQLSSLL
jgi:hypothetical protein